jgi:hypothetical protein
MLCSSTFNNFNTSIKRKSMNSANGCFSAKSLVNFLGLRIQSCRSSSLQLQILTISLFMLVMSSVEAGGEFSVLTKYGYGAMIGSYGQSNAAFGAFALYSNNSNGNYNTGIGHNSLYDNTSGDSNTALGYRSLFENTSGGSNTALGDTAGYSNQTGSNNIFLGYQAGYSETGSNKLYIDSSNTSTPLIYGDFASDALTINGTLNSTGNMSTSGTLTAASIMYSQGGIVNTGTLTSTDNISTSANLSAVNITNSGTLTSTGNISTSGTLTAAGNVIAPAFYHTDGTKMLSMQNGSLHLGASSMIFTDSSVSGNADIMHSSSGKIQLGNSTTDSTTVVGTLSVQDPTAYAHAANKGYVDTLRKDMRRYDRRSVALSSALTALPTNAGTGSHTCGMGAGVRGGYTAMAVGCAADLADFELPNKLPAFIKNASINAGTSFLAHNDPDYTFKVGMSFNFGKSQSKGQASNQGTDFSRALALVHQKTQLTANKQAEVIKDVQRDNREMKRVNLKVLAENKTIKDTNLRLQAQIDVLITSQDDILAMKEQLAQLTALIAGTEMVAAK